MIHLDFRDARPLYIQITENFRMQIEAGILQENDRLPSVRELAAELSINPNTIQRAYRELESRGLIATVAGKGCFVQSGGGKDASLWREFDEAADRLRSHGVTQQALLEHLIQGGSSHASIK